VASWRGSISPHSGGTVPDLHRVPSPRSVCGARAYHRPVPASLLRRWLPVLAWAGLIFAFSSIPSLGTDLGTWDLVLRKLAHLAEYAVLGALLYRAVGNLGVSFALGLLYAVGDEIHQTFVSGRHGSPVDVGIDAAGVLLGLAAWHALSTKRALA
jgi:VanZ family protein